MRISNTRKTLSGNCCQGKPWLLAAVFICACLLLPQAGFAAWSDDPIAVFVGEGDQCRPQVVYDGSGGYYVTWQDHEAEGVFAQHYDVNGDATWESPIQVGGGSQYHQQEAVADGNGGILVAWDDDRDYYTYVQRIDVDGNLAWGEGGVAVINEEEPWIASDGEGGAIVMSYYEVVNKVASDGSLPWADADNPLEYSTSSSATKIVSDGAGGAILLWDEYDLFSGIALQRIDAEGDFVWNEGEPLQLSAEGSSPSCPRLIPDNGGAIVVWEDSSSGYKVMAQKIDADGQIQWTEGGEEVATGTNLGYCEPASDGAGGAFITWCDWDTDTIYAQYIDANGDIVWDDPVAMSPEGDLYDVVQHPRRTVEDGLGGFITAWCNNDDEAKAQRCDATGAVLWTTAGVVLATGESISYEPKLASNGQGGAVAVWVDYLDGTYRDIFMQGVSAEGVVGDPGYTPPSSSSSGDDGFCFVGAVSAAAPGGMAGMLLLLITGAGWLSLARRR